MPISYATAGGQLRLLIADVDETSPVLSEVQVAGFLTMWGLAAETVTPAPGPVKRAAADALDAIATSESLISKVIRSQDLTTDGPKVAASLRAHATQLRVQADAVDAAAAAADDSYFGVAEFSPYPTGHRGEATEWGAW